MYLLFLDDKCQLTALLRSFLYPQMLVVLWLVEFPEKDTFAIIIILLLLLLRLIIITIINKLLLILLFLFFPLMINSLSHQRQGK